MSWRLEETEGKTGKKYRIWSTVIDGYLTGWMTEKRIKQFLYNAELRKFREAVTQALWTFPEEWMRKEDRSIIMGTKTRDFREWNYLTKTESARDAKFHDLLQEVDIEAPKNLLPQIVRTPKKK